MSERIDRFVSCVVLCHGDPSTLVRFVDTLSQTLRDQVADYELILISEAPDQVMRDVLADVIGTQPYVRMLQLTRSHSDAVSATAGLQTALGDYVCVLDSANDAPSLALRAVRRALDGFDVVTALDRRASPHGLVRRAAARVFAWYARRHLQLDVGLHAGTFRCLSRYAVNALTQLPQPHRYYRIWGDFVGLTTACIEHDGLGGRRKRSTFASVDEAIDLLVSVSPHPIRMLSALALVFAAGNLLYIAYIVGVFLFKPQVATGWTTLSLQVAALSLVVIILLGTLGEYVGKVLERTSSRPAYWVREEQTSTRFSDRTRLNVVANSNALELGSAGRVDDRAGKA